MMTASKRATATHLRPIVEAKKSALNQMQQGVRLANDSGYTIVELRTIGVRDRIALGNKCLVTATMLLDSDPPHARAAISRGYYALYHWFRATTYYVHGGDDHQEHKKLPEQIPSDFPNRMSWAAALKDSRYNRNNADYDPYPRTEKTLHQPALDLVATCCKAKPLVIQYLRGKGCQI